MNKIALLALLLVSPLYAFNGEIDSPTFTIRFGAVHKSSVNTPTSQGGFGDPGGNRAPYIDWYSKLGWVKNGPVVCAGCSASSAVQNFMNHSVFIGDSITAWWNLNSSFGTTGILNKGIPGETTSQILARFGTDALGSPHSAVFLLAGINDILTPLGANQRPNLALAEQNVATMVNMADAAHEPIFVGTLLVTVLQNNGRNLNGYTIPFNKWLQGYCNGSNCTVIDYNSALGGPNHFYPQLHKDLVHPNNQGYGLMSQAVINTVSQYVAKHPHCGRHR